MKQVFDIGNDKAKVNVNIDAADLHSLMSVVIRLHWFVDELFEKTMNEIIEENILEMRREREFAYYLRHGNFPGGD